MKFFKYQASGNDYLVVESSDNQPLTTQLIQRICDRHFGVGSDGILILEKIEKDIFYIRIFNPDGSESEKSGNGLRIFARYLYDQGYTGSPSFEVQTLSDRVQCQLHENGDVSIAMGQASFDKDKLALNTEEPCIIHQKYTFVDKEFTITAVSMGNPHCVCVLDEVSAHLAQQYGPIIENHSLFTHRTNVQFMKVIDRNNIHIEIWERGAGYTLSSGSSSSAAAAVAYRLKYCDNNICVHMPGGIIRVDVMDNFYISITGAVERIAEGRLSDEFIHLYQ